MLPPKLKKFLREIKIMENYSKNINAKSFKITNKTSEWTMAPNLIRIGNCSRRKLFNTFKNNMYNKFKGLT